MRIYSEVARARLVQDLAIEKITENVQKYEISSYYWLAVSNFSSHSKKQSLQIPEVQKDQQPSILRALEDNIFSEISR